MEISEKMTKWFVDPAKSTIAFKVDPKIFAAVEGTFRIFDAEVTGNADDFSSANVNLRIDASSISTGDAERDVHLKSADFFDVDNYRQITFLSGTVKVISHTGIYELSGNLTIKGITKAVTVNVQAKDNIIDASGSENIVFTISGRLNRNDWDLLWNASEGTGGLMESEEVDISCKITLTDNKR